MYRENKKFGFGDLAIEKKYKNDFLAIVNTLFDWNFIRKILKLNLQKDFNVIGQPPYLELLFFKILLSQTWFNLSDTKVENTINDRISFIKFLNLSIKSYTPNYSTISWFRNSLIKNILDKKLFLKVNR
ncbi:MAG: transposase [Fusobacteriaceae bacterium]|nr:transposase [Fusobacteriaceae bacterium]MBN2838357.1 transposase [Fusobacteriaceae bacterium]